ncbi:MAG: hypothetical protein V1915_03955 [Candidatus Bathyarchaeota archaeon]
MAELAIALPNLNDFFLVVLANTSIMYYKKWYIMNADFIHILVGERYFYGQQILI